MVCARALIVAGVAAACLPGISFSQDSKNEGYLVDADQNPNVVTSGTGLCWHTSAWTPAHGVAQCDPASVRKARAPAPTQVAVTPPPAQPAAAVTRQSAQRDPAPESASLPPIPIPDMTVLPQTVNFSADAFFDFDKSLLKPEGKKILDDLVRKLAGARYEAISVTGHTDRIGTAEYNQRLSERRANAVSEYLVSKNIPAFRIEAQGKGDMQPTIRSGDCDGPKSSKVVACLQPDRRVDIAVSGASGLTTASR
jgi:OmpA-OmpF porin, OOP family